MEAREPTLEKSECVSERVRERERERLDFDNKPKIFTFVLLKDEH